jgi:hypothetical protein
MMNRKLSQTLATAAVVATLLAGAAPAFAQTTSSQSHLGFFQGLIQFIEQKFGLSTTQVQSAVQQYQTQRKATITPHPTLTQDQKTAMEKTRLDKLVSSGKITSGQETDILNEIASVDSQYNLSSLQSDSQQQRETTMQEVQNALKTWAQAHNINPMYVMPFGGMSKGFGGHGMMRGGHGHWGHLTGTPTPTTAS